MRWRGGRRSQNVEDRRGRPARRMRPVAGGAGGIGCVGLLAIIAYLLLGGDPQQLAELVQAQPGSQVDPGAGSYPGSPPTDPNDAGAQFVSVVLASTEDVWGDLFRRSGSNYPAPRLVLFRDAVESACGFNTAATGPFYCPADRQVYLDLSFFDELARMGGAGDFAAAYVIGHEVGHHIQNVTGVNRQVRERQSRVGQVDSNRLQVAMELQADCYAGVWAHHANRTQQLLEPGDVEEGLAAAEAIGDDRLQRRAGRRVSPESFTHGTSAQRMEWLMAGLRSGDVSSCDTFGRLF